MSEYLVTETASFDYDNLSITGPKPIINLLTSNIVNKVKCQGNRVAKSIQVIIAGTSSGTCVQSAPVIATINGNSIKVKSDASSLVKEDAESATVTINGLIGSTPCSYTTKVVINDPGQNKVKVE